MFARADYDVVLYDIDAGALEKALVSVKEQLQGLKESGILKVRASVTSCTG